MMMTNVDPVFISNFLTQKTRSNNFGLEELPLQTAASTVESSAKRCTKALLKCLSASSYLRVSTTFSDSWKFEDFSSAS
jgi:hypothetical protein